MDHVNAVVLGVILDLWEKQNEVVRSVSHPEGRLWVRHVDFNNDSHGWCDWSLAALHQTNREWLDSIPADVPHGWIHRQKVHLEWCRTAMPDGPHTERLGDIAV